jgi:hypothetical protein
VAGRQGFEPRYRGPETVQTSSVILGRVVFVRQTAQIVGPSPVGGGPFACKVSSFFQEFRALVLDQRRSCSPPTTASYAARTIRRGTWTSAAQGRPSRFAVPSIVRPVALTYFALRGATPHLADHVDQRLHNIAALDARFQYHLTEYKILVRGGVAKMLLASTELHGLTRFLDELTTTRSPLLFGRPHTPLLRQLAPGHAKSMRLETYSCCAQSSTGSTPNRQRSKRVLQP